MECDSRVKKTILVVSFGTSYNKSRENTIGAIEKKIKEKFPDFKVKRAFTSQIIIDKLKKRDNIKVNNVTEAMEELAADGGILIVQPTYVISGYEYNYMIEGVSPYKNKFTSISYGKPLLSSDEDYKKVAEVLIDRTKEYNQDNTAIVFMGHGTEHIANIAYEKLDNILKNKGYKNYFIGTVEAVPSLNEVKRKVGTIKAEKVILLPLMIVAGDHANNDMASTKENSWNIQFKLEGYKVECIIKGLGEYIEIQNIFAEHVQTIIDRVKVVD